MADRLHSSHTLLEGMNTIQFGDGQKDAVTRKRELEEAIRVPQLSIGDCFVHARVYLYAYFHPRSYIRK